MCSITVTRLLNECFDELVAGSVSFATPRLTASVCVALGAPYIDRSNRTRAKRTYPNTLATAFMIQ